MKSGICFGKLLRYQKDLASTPHGVDAAHSRKNTGTMSRKNTGTMSRQSTGTVCYLRSQNEIIVKTKRNE